MIGEVKIYRRELLILKRLHLSRIEKVVCFQVILAVYTNHDITFYGHHPLGTYK